MKYLQVHPSLQTLKWTAKKINLVISMNHAYEIATERWIERKLNCPREREREKERERERERERD